MTSEEFSAVVAEIKKAMIAGGQDENVLEVDTEYRTVRLPLPHNQWMGVEFERVPLPAGPFAARITADHFLRAYGENEAWKQ